MGKVCCALALSCLSAICLSVSGAYVIKMLGAPAAQIAGKLNIFVTIALSSAFLGEKLNVLQILSAILVVVGAAIFEKGQRNHGTSSTEAISCKEKNLP